MLGVILNIKGKGNYFLKLAGPHKTVSAAAAQLRASFGGNEKEEKEFKIGGET
jgi:gluconolactonase